MKHHCEGLRGWFSGDGCPSSWMTVPPGQTFTAEQRLLLESAFTLVAILMLAALAAIFVAFVVSMLDDN